MKKTFTIFSEGSMYLKNGDKIIGSLEGIQYDTKKFKGRISIRKLDVKPEEVPTELEVKIFQLDKKGLSNKIEIKKIKLTDKFELNKLLEFDYDEVIETNKGIPKATSRIVGKLVLDEKVQGGDVKND